MSRNSFRIVGIGALVAVSFAGALAQTMPSHHGSTMHATPHAGTAAAGPISGQPTLPGQDAFGAIQEIVRILEADPRTDWSRINLSALREHLIDMNEVTLRAAATERQIAGGLEIQVTGQGRTLDAIRRMIPAHGRELNQLNGWRAATAPTENGITLTVTSGDPREVAHIRGLGFIGLLVSGGHHQPHHLAMARGEFQH